VWLAEFVEDDVDGVAPCDDAYSSYLRFVRAREHVPMSNAKFGAELKKVKGMGDPMQRTVPGKTGYPRCYLGIRLKTPGRG
jgi:hypothetical protein